MSASPSGGVRCGLSRLVAEVDVLAEKHWGRTPLLTPADQLPSPAGLFGSAAVDELLSVRGLRTPFVKMVKQGRTVPESAYTSGGGVGATIGDQVSEDKVLGQFAQGASIVLQGLHRTWAPVVVLAQEVAADLGHPVQVNAYVTPPDSRGFDVHYDVHDVFVVQVEGHKRWEVREPVLANPLRTQPSADHEAEVRRAAESAPWLETVLTPGDCLYLPRGWLHSATSPGGTSIHLTIGVHVWTAHQVLEQIASLAIRELSQEPEARASLPLGVDVGDADALAPVLREWGSRLQAAVESLQPADVSAGLSARARAAQRPAPLGALAQLDCADKPATPWAVRGHLGASWTDGGLVSRVGAVAVAGTDRAAVADILDGADPGDLRPDLVRRLVLAGILVPA